MSLLDDAHVVQSCMIALKWHNDRGQSHEYDGYHDYNRQNTGTLTTDLYLVYRAIDQCKNSTRT
jgi:hypothetical protein